MKYPEYNIVHIFTFSYRSMHKNTQSRLFMYFDESERNEIQIKIYSFKYYNKYHSLYFYTLRALCESLNFS